MSKKEEKLIKDLLRQHELLGTKLSGSIARRNNAQTRKHLSRIANRRKRNKHGQFVK